MKHTVWVLALFPLALAQQPAGSVLPGTQTFQGHGMGAVARPINDKLADLLSVKDFGARGDCVTDDRAAIQSAITQAGKAGGTVLFPQGSCFLVATNPHAGTISEVITLSPGVSFDGGGTVKVGNGLTYSALFGYTSGTVVTPVSFRNITIDFNGANGPISLDPSGGNQHIGFRVGPNGNGNGSRGVTFQNVTFLNGNGVSTIDANVIDDVTVQTCHWLNWGAAGTLNFDSSLLYINGDGGIVSGNDFTGIGPTLRTAIEVHGGNKVVTGNIINGFAYGIIYSPNRASAANVIISNNTLHVTSGGVQLWTEDGELDGAVVSGNVVLMDREGIVTNYGIRGSEQGIAWYQNSRHPLKNVKISGNVVRWTGETTSHTTLPVIAGIALYNNYGPKDGYAADIADCEVSGNTVVNSPAAGIAVAANKIFGLVVAHNIAINSGRGLLTPWGSGIIVHPKSLVSNTHITDNAVSDNGNAAKMFAGISWLGTDGDGAPEQVEIRGNAVSYTARANFRPYVVSGSGPFLDLVIPRFTPGALGSTFTEGNYPPIGSTVFDPSTGKRWFNMAANGLAWTASAGPDRGATFTCVAGEHLTITSVSNGIVLAGTCVP